MRFELSDIAGGISWAKSKLDKFDRHRTIMRARVNAIEANFLACLSIFISFAFPIFPVIFIAVISIFYFSPTAESMYPLFEIFPSLLFDEKPTYAKHRQSSDDAKR